ncbi:MAG: hypothetical protein Q9191_004253 [Dirinaria sp. TL-2023a]
MQAATAAADESANYTGASGTSDASSLARQQRGTVTETITTFASAEQGLSSTSSRNASSRKRKRQTNFQEPQYASQVPLHEEANSGKSALRPKQDSQEAIDSDTSVAGIQSAAALFRSPSSSSKKYTRPPMSKLYTSLELSPENFLHLQATAKSYMLDPEHPERRDCVGQRGRGDSELVKMRLWNCVARFLDEDRHGQSYFGEDVPGNEGAKRTMSWPRDRSKIIGAVIPLLRRMVTNERQRQYAVETRKGTSSSREKKIVPEDPMVLDDSRSKQDSQPVANGEEVLSVRGSESFKLQFNIHVLRDGHRVIQQRFDTLAEECPDRQQIYAQLLQVQDGGIVTSLEGVRVSVLLPQGLVAVNSDSDWLQALSSVRGTVWMDGEVKVLIELPPNQ